MWCSVNEDNDFDNYWFADETTIYENECPNYAWRPIGSYPESAEISRKSSKKLNLWCAISYKGVTNFVVSIYVILKDI